MASMTEVPPKEKMYAITVTEAERDVIAKALVIYRNVDYFCTKTGNPTIREMFVGRTSFPDALTALEIIREIRSE